MKSLSHKNYRIICALAFLAGSSTATATRPFVRDQPAMPGPSLNAGDEFYIEKYDEKSRSYHLHLEDDPSSDALDASPEALAAAVEQINLEAIKAAPYSIVGPKEQEFTFTVSAHRELELLTSEQIKRRQRGH